MDPPESIIRYDILWRSNAKHLLKSTLLDRDYKNPTEEIVVMVYDSLKNCISGIIGRFRNMEIQSRAYESLQPVDQLSALYDPLVNELMESVMHNNISSFSFFGKLSKYNPQTRANDYLHSLGYFVLSTNRPYMYVLEDFIKAEIKTVQH
jgi:hypothetical protein